MHFYFSKEQDGGRQFPTIKSFEIFCENSGILLLIKGASCYQRNSSARDFVQFLD